MIDMDSFRKEALESLCTCGHSRDNHYLLYTDPVTTVCYPCSKANPLAAECKEWTKVDGD